MSTKYAAFVVLLGVLIALPMMADPPANDRGHIQKYERLDETIDEDLEEDMPSDDPDHTDVAPVERPVRRVAPDRVEPERVVPAPDADRRDSRVERAVQRKVEAGDPDHIVPDPTDPRADPMKYTRPQRRGDDRRYDWRYHMRKREGRKIGEVETRVDFDLKRKFDDIADRNPVRLLKRTVERRFDDSVFLDRHNDRHQQDRVVDGRLAKRVDGRMDMRVEREFDRRVDKETEQLTLARVEESVVRADLGKRAGVIQLNWPAQLTDVDVLLTGKSGLRLVDGTRPAVVDQSGRSILIPVRYRTRRSGAIHVKFTGAYDTLLISETWVVKVRRSKRDRRR